MISSIIGIGLKNYQGETHPFILFFSIILGLILLLSGILFLTWKILRKMKFSKILKEADLNVIEQGILINSLTRQQVSDPFLVISDKAGFDYFANNVARYYLSLDLPIEDLRKEGSIFQQLRKKLEFSHNFKQHIISSSRCLDPGTPLSISFNIEETTHTFQFLSRILENNDFFISIQPPVEHDIQDLLQSGKKISVEIAFSRSQDAQYYFHSYYIRATIHPQKMWLFTHSNSFQKIPLTPPMNIEAKLLFFNEDTEENTEEKVKILTFHQHRCFITLESELSLIQGQHVLLNFNLENNALTCGALIEDILNLNEEVIYQVAFNFLDPETKNTLLNFQSTRRKKLKAKIKEAQST
jgi:hypothetical protein